MPVVVKQVAAALALIVVLAPVAIGAPKCPPCMDGRLQALQDGGFSGFLFCDDPDSEFRFLGRIKGEAYSYLIYDYRHDWMGPGSLHTNHGLVVFDAKGKYLGGYVLPNGVDGAHITIAGTFLRWRGENETGAIDFSDGPPTSILVLGEVDEFDR